MAATHLEVLERIGPQMPSESGLMRRTRFHQSWYRSEVLGLTRFGQTASVRPRPLGSIITDSDAARGLNFTSSSAYELYSRRRKAGWGVDPVRCTKYLTSSQALTLNIFGPLVQSPDWCREILSYLLRRDDLRRVLAAEIEFAPPRRSEHLGDMTRVDAFLRIETGSGVEAIVIEVKYADRFNSRFVDLRHDAYRQLADTTRLWSNPDAVLASRKLNQLARVHAIAASAIGPSHARKVPPTLVILHHPGDSRSEDFVDDYRALVTRPDSVASIDLSMLFETMSTTAITDADRRMVNEMRTRYIEHHHSQELWEAHRQMTRSAIDVRQS